MDTTRICLGHYQEHIPIHATASEVFAFIDNHRQFSSHMNKSSWMMAGAAMHTDINEGNGQIVGSHIKMNSTILGIRLFLDEVVTLHDPPRVKTWETVGNVHLLVIGHYRMGVSIKPEGNSSDVTVSIDYNLPNSHTWLGKLFGGIYAKWCVEQMTQGVKTHFTH